MKLRSRWLTKLAAWLLVGGFRLLFATCRKVHLAPELRLTLNSREAESHPESFILSIWHDALIIPTFAASPASRRRACCLVSRHQDGSYLADAMAILGYSTVRGSSHRGGAAALKQLLDETAGKHLVITPDGPRGPRRELKPGVVYLAAQTGRRVCACAYTCRRGWRVQGSWTDMLIPLPFTTVYLLTSAPISIPSELAREQLHEHIAVVQAAMDRLDADAECIRRGEALTAPQQSVRRAA